MNGDGYLVDLIKPPRIVISEPRFTRRTNSGFPNSARASPSLAIGDPPFEAARRSLTPFMREVAPGFRAGSVAATRSSRL